MEQHAGGPEEVERRGRHVAVAGGTTSLGRAIARGITRPGDRLSVCGRSPGHLRVAVDELGAEQRQVLGTTVDVTEPGAAVAWLAGAVERHGPVDALVAVVGGNRDPERWDEVFTDNVFWVVPLLDWAADHLVAGGSVVLLSSIAARLPQLGREQAAYGASKAALEHLTRHAVRPLGRRGVRVNAVAPGPVVAPGGYWDVAAADDPELVSRLSAAAGLGRLVTADEVASCVDFLAGPTASGVTGAVLRCDAGMEASLS